MIVIGERINASRKSIRTAIQEKDRGRIEEEVVKQDQAGADYIDLNAGTGSGDTETERNDMKWLIDIALSASEKALCIDTADPVVMESAAEHLSGSRPWMLNSVKAEEGILSSLLPIAAENDVPVIALLMSGEIIASDDEQRIEAADFIVNKAEELGVGQDKLFFDPLAFPLSADISQGRVTFRTLRKVKEQFPQAKTTMGLSNVSHGLKKRRKINQAFLIASIANGLDSAICDPTREEITTGILLGELIAGKDRYCRKYSRAVRKGVI
jgi:5-methyltetrahydrofolate--homocysteine methyltransferase